MPHKCPLRFAGLLAAIAACAALLGACQPLPVEGPLPPLDLRNQPTATPTIEPSATPIETPWPTVYITAVPTRTPEPLREEIPTVAPEARAWAEKAGLIEPAPASYDDLLAGGLAEGQVFLYADSGRALTALESLARSTEGFSAEGMVADSQDIALQLADDAASGTRGADLVLYSDPGDAWALTQQGRLWTWIPPDQAEVLAGAEQEGLLTHHWTPYLWVHNPKLSWPSPASWWELTEPAWQARVALADPRASARSLNLLVALSQEADQLEADYVARYGAPLKLSKGCPDAACEWFKRMLANQPVLLPGEAEVAQRVNSGEGDVQLGLCGLDILARVGGAPSVYPVTSLAPFIGLQERSYIAVTDRALHAQAAKLAIRWLLGDPPCQRGWATWCVAGFYTYHSEIPDPPGLPASRELLPTLINLSPSYAYEHHPEVVSWAGMLLADRPLQY